MPITERPITESMYNAGVSDALSAKAPLSHVGAGGAEHPKATTSAAGFMSTADKTKLDGIATGATANATDADLRNRSTHTGTQAASTISDFSSAARAVNLSGLTFPAATAVTTSDTVLSGFGKLQSQVTAALAGSAYKGTWNASTNTPTITAGTGSTGDSYVVSVAGTQSITGESVAFTVGDTVKFNGSAWQRIPSYAAVSSVAGRTGAVVLTSADVGLGNVDNTSDADKPISTAQQTALDGKAPLSHVGAGGAEHPKATEATDGFMSATDKAKLDGIATGATANATDADLRDRSTHTGTQAASTISDFSSAARAVDLSGLTFPAATAVTTSDTVLSGFGKLQSQVTAALAGSAYSSSDERVKKSIAPIDDTALDAWETVGFCQYQFADAVAAKGSAARIHTGVIAQRVVDAFKAHGLDASRYGLLCYDRWDASPAVTEDRKVLVTPPVMDGENVVTPGVYTTETVVLKEAVEAGDRYGIRYAEAQAMEAACQRRRADRLEARIAAIESKLGS